MSETVAVDLVAWLTQIWDEDTERLSSPYFCGPVWPTTDELLARIAADRQILERAVQAIEEAPPHGRSYDWDGDYAVARASAFEEVLRLLASPYKGREGWQEEWGHE